jgi:sulfite reductase beta subunit-like hemoprotein
MSFAIEHWLALHCPPVLWAVTESERVFNDVLEGIHAKIAAYGLLEKSPIIRMTGCPNGCARPYSAEIGIVGQAKDKYAIFVGGNHEGTKIGRLFKQKIPLAEIPDALEKLLGQWKENSPDTYLGEYVETTDWEDLLEAC